MKTTTDTEGRNVWPAGARIGWADFSDLDGRTITANAALSALPGDPAVDVIFPAAGIVINPAKDGRRELIADNGYGESVFLPVA